MRAISLAVVVLASCYKSDPQRASETLRLHGFTSAAVTDVQYADWSKCPDNCGAACAQVTSCTNFNATAPWGWPVTGVVVCPSHGSCAIHVLFESPKQQAKP